jgi:hypothetical protein
VGTGDGGGGGAGAFDLVATNNNASLSVTGLRTAGNGGAGGVGDAGGSGGQAASGFWAPGLVRL